MLTHTEKWNLHEPIPKLHLSMSALHACAHAHTHTSCVYSEYTCTHTWDCRILSKVQKQQLLVNLRNYFCEGKKKSSAWMRKTFLKSTP